MGTGLVFTPDADRDCAFVTIELANLWLQFCRAYYLSSALRAYDWSGRRITISPPTGTTVTTPHEAMTLAVRTAGKGTNRTAQKASWAAGEEPDWQVPKTFQKVMTALNASTASYADLVAGFQTRTFSDLPRVRNFYAHRSHRSVSSARNLSPHYAVPRFHHTTELLIARAAGRPHSILTDWVDDIRAAVELTRPAVPRGPGSHRSEAHS